MSYNQPPQYPQQGYPPMQQGGYAQQQQYQGGVPPQQPVYVATTQMNPQVVERGGESREWRHGLFDCFGDCGLCLKTWCCPCITYGESKAKFNNDVGSCYMHSLLYCCASFLGVPCLPGILHRNEMRSRYGINGSGCGDFCTHLCCNCCALIQEHREANSR